MADRKGRRPPTVEVVRRPAPNTSTPTPSSTPGVTPTPVRPTGTGCSEPPLFWVSVSARARRALRLRSESSPSVCASSSRCTAESRLRYASTGVSSGKR